jgi:hypothetical protein
MGKKKKAPVKRDGVYLIVENAVALLSQKKTPPPPPVPVANPIAFAIYREAHQYRNAADHLWLLARKVHPNFMYSAVTVEAFSCELFLKCILADHHKTASRIHDIEDLFNQLDATEQNNIESLYSFHLNTAAAREYISVASRLNIAMDLKSVLRRCSDLFEGTRYQYDAGGVQWSLDSNGHGGTFGLRFLIHALWMLTFAGHPDWDQVIRDEDKIHHRDFILEEDME